MVLLWQSKMCNFSIAHEQFESPTGLVRNCLTETIFRSKLKTHLFSSTYGFQRLLDFNMHF